MMPDEKQRVIDLGLIPIVVHDAETARRAGEMVEARLRAYFAAIKPTEQKPA